MIHKHLEKIKHVVLDMDGTVYLGARVFPWTEPFLTLLGELGITHTFVTNNCSRSAEQYVQMMRAMGIVADAEDIYTSGHATIEYLRQHRREIRRLFVLGTMSLKGELEAAGFTVVGLDAHDEPDAVVVGFDTALDYENLCRAAWWIREGKRFFATHPDRVCPTDEPVVMLDCGAICACLEYATGHTPDAVLGKPSPEMVHGVLRRYNLSAEQLAVVGDRLYTDMAMARDCGSVGVLVLSGETTREQGEAAEHPPDLMVPTLDELGRLLKEAARC